MRIVSRLFMLVALVALAGCGNSSSPSDSGGKGGPSQPIDSFAVLPFTGQWDKPAAAQDNWPERVRGLLEEIIPDAISSDVVEQAPSGTLKVIPTTTAREKKLIGQPAQEAGKTLKVGAVLAGKVTGGGELSVQLVEVKSGALLWGNTYNLFFGFSEEHGSWRINIQDQDRQDIVWNVVLKLTGHRTGPPQEAVGHADPAAAADRPRD
jgi:TolB-like protein